jgi:hypothetical protein
VLYVVFEFVVALVAVVVSSSPRHEDVREVLEANGAVELVIPFLR